MRLQILSPSPQLSNHVRHFWALTAETEPSDGTMKSDVLPDGTMQLIVHWGTPFLERTTTADAQSTRTQSAIQLCGPSVTAKSVETQGTVGMLAAVFEPWAFHSLVRSNVYELCGVGIGADAVFGSQTALLADELAELSSLGERRIAFERFLLERLDRSDAAFERLDFLRRCVDVIQSADDVSTLPQKYRALGVSERTFQRRFRESVGLRPGQFRRIRRLQQAVSLLRAGKSLVEVAASCGYADQAHMTREFGELTSMTPRCLAVRYAISE